MFKAMILLSRKQDMSSDAFKHWWLTEHRPLAAQLPGLRRGTFNLVEEGGESGIDGISELWFDNMADFEAAYASEIGKRVAQDSLSKVDRRTRLFVAETDVLM